MFAALSLILNQVASITIGPYIKIGFSGIPNQLADYLFGPVTGGLFAGILDVVKYFMKPDGPFFFGFTFNAILASLIYGCFYYKKKLTLKRVLLAKFVVFLVVNVILSTPVCSITFVILKKIKESIGHIITFFNARIGSNARNPFP